MQSMIKQLANGYEDIEVELVEMVRVNEHEYEYEYEREFLTIVNPVDTTTSDLTNEAVKLVIAANYLEATDIQAKEETMKREGDLIFNQGQSITIDNLVE